MPRATLQDVADKANVSRTTASLILNGKPVRVSEETRRNVIQAAQELQYTPNALIRSLQTQQTYTIGVYIGAGDDFLNLYIGTLFNAIRHTAEKQGYDVLVYRTGNSSEPIDASLFLDGRVDGVVFWGGLRPVSYADLARAGLPVVVLLDEPKDVVIPTLSFDDKEGMKQALQHLTDLGHRKIAYLSGRAVSHLRHRLEAFQQAAESKTDRRLDIQTWSFASPVRIPVKERLSDSLNRPTAVICAFDALAVRCLEAAHDAGLRVPEDLSVVSWEDLHSTGVRPFTSVAHQVTVLGSESVNYLVELIQSGASVPVNRLLPVSFNVRGSTGQAPHQAAEL